MEVSPDVEYKELRTHLRFLNDKINEAFSLFIKLATAIIGGEFYLHWKLAPNDTQRHLLARGLNVLLMVVGVAMALIILDTMYTWCNYRKTLSKRFPKIPCRIGIRTIIAELLMVVIIMFTIIVFTIYNPL